MRLVLALLLTGIIGVVTLGCRGSEPPPDDVRRDATYARPGPRHSDVEEARLFLGDVRAALDRLGETDVVFVGTVERVEPSPGFWSGILAVHQVVHYRVERVHRGALPAERVAIAHPIVGPSLTQPDVPELSHRIWFEGARLLLVARPDAGHADGALTGSHASFGPLRADGPAARRVIDGL